MKPIWADLLSEHDKRCLANQPEMAPVRGLGERPALLVIDMQVGIIGEDKPIYEQQDKYPGGCGNFAWSAIRHMKKLIPTARDAGIPILFSRFVYHPESGFVHPPTYMFNSENPYSEIIDDLKPVKGDIVIEKNRASIFFQTPALYYLLNKKVDTLLVTGTSTSGCVRASVIDGTGYMFKVALVEECVFDRLELAHKSSMFDLQFKYCDVMSIEETYDYIEKTKK